MTKFKVCCITTNPEQFKVEMEAVFGPSKVLMNKRPNNETGTMIHLGFTLSKNMSINEISNLIPGYVKRQFNFSVNPI